ncbi:MAG: hypothetical protein AUG16_03840 [Thaumarchaeota archaeon 13_1_20CM_2_39_20]|nr:MAG: hypothetical protein AUI59_01250 [Thaumarchaeota archaeon 13_1_40CM_2_39_13_1]OLE40520.1 MAG: hypothetical protein AUG16_03840 [Thaumarchaeota archaeon 13_1_20CM_2_39_20]
MGSWEWLDLVNFESGLDFAVIQKLFLVIGISLFVISTNFAFATTIMVGVNLIGVAIDPANPCTKYWNGNVVVPANR